MTPCMKNKLLIPNVFQHVYSSFYSTKKTLVFFCFFFFLLQTNVTGQTVDDLSNVKVEELTDEQVRTFVAEADRRGLRDEQVEQMALQRGMSPIEVVKLKTRVQSIRKAILSSAPADQQPGTSSPQPEQDSMMVREQKPLSDYTTVFSALQSKNFGAEVFHNARITFEPNLRLPTPKNYQLAADDELLIDVSGYSEASYKLKVSPEGIIRIPVVGPIHVNGLTIEQARKIITQRLANTIYSNIKTGRTTVEITLSSIRSIKVIIIGEATAPGTYTLPSLATAYNALHACGGPNLNGSFRDIQVIRNNKTVATIDVYQYLANGTRNGDINLRDQDVIKINTYSIRVDLKGEVKKPGLYDVAPGETISQVLQYAGGFTDNAYTARIQVFRNTSKERKVTTLREEELANSVPQKGDSYIIGKILNRFSNRVSIKGAVYRPGEYELNNAMTLSQLVSHADGLREDAFISRGTIHRLKDDLSPEIISFDVEKVLKGDAPDIPLKREDRVEIFSKFDLKEGYYVKIEGEVSSPGTFLYEEGLNVQDVILMAGGLKESASIRRIEISRRVKDADPTSTTAKTAVIYQQDIPSDLRDSSETAQFILQPFDEVVIRSAPGYTTQKNAVVEGEVIYTGKYTLEGKNDRISDLVKRAGGLTPESYLEGAVLIRSRIFSKTQQSNYEQGLNNLVLQNYKSGTDPAIIKYQLDGVTQKHSDFVGIDLRKAMDAPGSKYDLILNDGDTLRIPKLLQTVRINGEVLYPALARYDKNLSFKEYIIGAGGFSDRSSKKKSYVVYANGSAKGTKSFLFFKSYPDIKPGAEIYVPIKRERERLRTGEIITIGATLVSMMAILATAVF
jgi:protein involved in polysaccharide export with SLBB domain